MYEFDVKKVTEDVVQWIRDFFEVNGKDCKAVVAVSGGKDSSVVAALCVKAWERIGYTVYFCPTVSRLISTPPGF